MAAAKRLLILDGRSPGDDTAGPLPPLLDRLEHRGFHIQVLVPRERRTSPVTRGSLKRGVSSDAYCDSSPHAGSGPTRGLTARTCSTWLTTRWSIWPFPYPKTGQLPYVQTVAGFATVERGLKLSRRWCRRLIATRSDLADELNDELGIPHEWIALIPQGVVAGPGLTSRRLARGTIPVIGTGGPQEEGPGLLVFTEAARLVVGAGYDVEFVIACAAREQIALRHLAKRLGIAERVTVADYPIVGPDFWSVLDIYCQPAVDASRAGCSRRPWLTPSPASPPT